MEHNELILEKHGRVAVLTIDRPARRNALGDALVAHLRTALIALDNDADVGAIVLAANSHGFCAGSDLKELAAISLDGGASATHGEFNSRSKYTAPVNRTARNTSERTSAVISHPRLPDARASRSDGGADVPHLRTRGNTTRTTAHGSACVDAVA